MVINKFGLGGWRLYDRLVLLAMCFPLSVVAADEDIDALLREVAAEDARMAAVVGSAVSTEGGGGLHGFASLSWLAQLIHRRIGPRCFRALSLGVVARSGRMSNGR